MGSGKRLSQNQYRLVASALLTLVPSEEKQKVELTDPCLACCARGGGWRFQGTPVLHPHTWNDACPVPSTLLVLVVAHARPRPADLQPGALLVDKVKPSLVSCRVQEAE